MLDKKISTPFSYQVNYHFSHKVNFPFQRWEVVSPTLSPTRYPSLFSHEIPVSFLVRSPQTLYAPMISLTPPLFSRDIFASFSNEASTPFSHELPRLSPTISPPLSVTMSPPLSRVRSRPIPFVMRSPLFSLIRSPSLFLIASLTTAFSHAVSNYCSREIKYQVFLPWDQLPLSSLRLSTTFSANSFF